MSAPHSVDALIKHIQSRYKDMSPQFQIGAHYLIDHPTEITLISMRKIASLAGVHPATLVRLAQYLGYAGWDEMKAVFSDRLRMLPGGYADRAQALVADTPSRATAWEQTVHAQSVDIHALGSANATALPDAIQALHQARRLHITGFRASHAVAFSFQYLCSLFKPEVFLLDNHAGTLNTALHHLSPDDVIVLISFAPYSREIMQISAAAVHAGCTIIALSDSKLAPIALEADHVLTFATHSSSFFPSTVAAQALVELLAQHMLLLADPSAIQGLADIERRLHDTGAYL
ncbi:MurR/RpiR family transcriptional regulator [Alcaligenaceae bacterium CGII-47]|nr:MurR/RpiR family transcriptional regulator [Alcaligenaceae bacterium CGII-47]